MSDHDPDSDSARGTAPPRAMSFERYQFNFRVDLGAQVAARFGGAPAFSLRRARLHRDLEVFWDALDARYEALWGAAREGRIDEEGREIRQNLLDASGSDRIGAREHRRRLHAAGIDPDAHAVEAFNRAWTRQVDRCDLAPLAEEVAAFVDYFPIESGMPMDPETEQYVWMGEPWVPPVAPTRESVLERYPFR
jgi:hypothetical protein